MILPRFDSLTPFVTSNFLSTSSTPVAYNKHATCSSTSASSTYTMRLAFKIPSNSIQSKNRIFLNEAPCETSESSGDCLEGYLEEEYTFPQANNSVRIAERSISTSVNYRGSRYLTTGRREGNRTRVERRNRMNGAVAHHGGGV